MPEKSRLPIFVFWLLLISAGLSSFLALIPATAIPHNQAITQKKFDCEFVSFQRDEFGKKGFHCLDKDSLKSALMFSSGVGVATLLALACIVFGSKLGMLWRHDRGTYFVLVGIWAWFTALYIASIRLSHFAFGRVSIDYFWVTLVWIAIVVVLPLMAWLESRSYER
ncbi:MAG: hypothetical protein U5L73_05100 [Rhodoferax sp.]|uniref:hypothetical protein n=1 Tax=Rhodoferax sp. TaxID=50421 RepID=UPI002ACE7ACB|nr:hypothetical protein [Rhodoferax sp.]MDZ7891119.1 hypothetical protein [Rhodoferax sp.]